MRLWHPIAFVAHAALNPTVLPSVDECPHSDQIGAAPIDRARSDNGAIFSHVCHPLTVRRGGDKVVAALRPCNGPGRGRRCPTRELIPKGKSRCASCSGQADVNRRPEGNPYKTAGHRHFRDQVLARDPVCVICRVVKSTDADHYPIDRRELVRRGLNPNDPQYGRGLCHACHARATAEHQPGGWNQGL